MMMRRFGQYLCAALSVGWLVLASSQPVAATIVFDDHFDGDSGGMPEGWYRLFDAGTVVEAGTTVTLYGDVAIGSYAMVDPSQGTITLTAEVAAYPEADDVFVVAFLASTMDNILGFDLRRSDGQISVGGFDSPGDWQVYVAGYLSGYHGGAIALTLELGPTEFTIAADSPPFFAGPIAYTEAFPTLTREDLGPEAMLLMQNDEYEPEGNWFSVDRITVDAQGGTPAEAPTWGSMKALFRE